MYTFMRADENEMSHVEKYIKNLNLHQSSCLDSNMTMQRIYIFSILIRMIIFQTQIQRSSVLSYHT